MYNSTISIPTNIQAAWLLIMKMTRLSITSEITSEVAKHFTARILTLHVFIQAFCLAAIFLNLK